jgi:hypothetical protein
MNRIKQIAMDAANDVADQFVVGFFDDRMVEHVADEILKHNLLIISECLSKIEEHRIPVGNSAAGELACEWTYQALEAVRAEIKEHFGVE